MRGAGLAGASTIAAGALARACRVLTSRVIEPTVRQSDSVPAGYLNSAKERTVRISNRRCAALLTIKGITSARPAPNMNMKISFDADKVILNTLAKNL